MIRVRVSKVPNLKLKMPPVSFYRGVGIDAHKSIRVRTETKKVDFEGKGFKAYTPDYAAFRTQKGRSATPNLSFTGAMLGSIQVLAKKGMASLLLSGESGRKAWGQESQGRLFFYLSKKEKTVIVAKLKAYMTKKNRLHG